MNAEWFRKSTVGTQASIASAIARHVFDRADIRAVSMRTSLARDANEDVVLFDPHYKSGPVFYRAKQQHRHGINADTWHECRDMAAKHRGPSCIVVFEAFTSEFSSDWSGSLLIATIKRIDRPEYGRNERPMKVYWPRRAFIELCKFSPDAAVAAAERNDIPDLRVKLESVLTPRTQAAMFFPDSPCR